MTEMWFLAVGLICHSTFWHPCNHEMQMVPSQGFATEELCKEFAPETLAEIRKRVTLTLSADDYIVWRCEKLTMEPK